MLVALLREVGADFAEAANMAEGLRQAQKQRFDLVCVAAKLPDALDGVAYAVGADTHTPEAYERAYVRGLERLIDALASKRGVPRRLVFVSSTAVYAQDAGEWVDEVSPTEPREFSGRTLLRAEAMARSAPFEGRQVSHVGSGVRR